MGGIWLVDRLGRSSAPRQCIHGYFDPNVVSLLVPSLIIEALKAKLTGEGIFVGSHALVHDEYSYMVECGDVQALLSFSDLIEEAIIISRR